MAPHPAVLRHHRPKEITALARKYQKDALRIDTLVRNQPHADIEYRAVRVPPRESEHAVVNVLRYFEAPTALVFCATRDGVRHLHASLQERGFTSVALSGELTQNERTRAVQAMRDGQARVCVATDVAARGLDLPDLGLVIHADLPTNKEMLLHRSGRTGRAGRKGTCVLIVPANRARAAESLISSAGVSAEWRGAPLPEEIRARDGARLLGDPVLTDEMTADDLTLARTLLEGRSAEDIAAALVRMYRARLPAPEEITELSPLTRHAARTRPGCRRTARKSRLRLWPQRPASPLAPWCGSASTSAAPRKADPKWLLPLICRMGGVEKRDIGAIRIQDRETRFEITLVMSESFASNLPDDAQDNVRVTRSEAPAPAPRREFGAPKRFVKTAPVRKSSASNARQRKGP